MNHDPTKIDFVIYHSNCSDGFGAAWSAWKLLGNKAEYFAATHGDEPPNVAGKNVAILDFSYDNSTIKKMISKAKSLIVIDHHKSALVELHDITNTIFDMNKSGARLAWDFFHPGKSPPKFIEYIEDRDLWKWELAYSKEFSAAFAMIPFDFEAFTEFEDDSVFRKACKKGSYILAYSKTVVKKIADQAILRTCNGKKVYIVNSSHWMSEIGAKLSPDCDFAVVWYYDHDRHEYRVSLRSFHDNIDVSEIAKKFGGGGHKKAAGFSLPKNTHVDSVFQDDSDLAPDDASIIPNLVKEDIHVKR
jgi:oligoribonuclease NrnB/cAMP/cGMP phosphodiesterase (DHH superfamily)